MPEISQKLKKPAIPQILSTNTHSIFSTCCCLFKDKLVASSVGTKSIILISKKEMTIHYSVPIKPYTGLGVRD